MLPEKLKQTLFVYSPRLFQTLNGQVQLTAVLKSLRTRHVPDDTQSLNNSTKSVNSKTRDPICKYILSLYTEVIITEN